MSISVYTYRVILGQGDENKRAIDAEDINTLITHKENSEGEYGLDKENEDHISQDLMVRFFL